ncbi:DNA-formamidopyrimidine glycosylase [Acidovorax sp. SRB_14]|uniref:bifunctional DNA-formamidopyrimidine glycosylase/DNA-(apurinic or apyrimidinic site) lyase n=1 Tax=Acidovorax sp. SRB_14 TaxID=1962699 RepID=UPI00156567D6|nr:bifunctional DNA-formamidopyrimidine glycosylase/DNA-(apurinic or apyrimidinic site) lyase [Acidovorax sp. SRB_14]NMM79994.1 DNA-formamidopyrimidine glycosylase [Acidovorax sp. SRB_14]
MPELPEVEVTRRSFAAAIAGGRILSVETGKPLRWPLGIDAQRLQGRRVMGVRRRGKYLLLDLDEGMLLLHLGMSGSLGFAQTLPARGVHDHFELFTTHGVLRLHDPRRFGAVVYAGSEQDAVVIKLLSGLGMEPLSDGFSLERFKAGLKAARAPVKQVLLAGKLVVGVGNIYASEVLFMAGIRPTTSAMHIGPKRAQRLYDAIRQVLHAAVDAGGSTLRDFSSADGQTGHFQLQARVYAREGMPCHTCTTPVRMLRQGQRSSFYCPKCQRA